MYGAVSGLLYRKQTDYWPEIIDQDNTLFSAKLFTVPLPGPEQSAYAAFPWERQIWPRRLALVSGLEKSGMQWWRQQWRRSCGVFRAWTTCQTFPASSRKAINQVFSSGLQLGYSLSLPPWHGSRISTWTVFSSKTETSRYQLWSSKSNQLIIVPPLQLSIYGPCSFAVAVGLPTVWNNVSEYLRDSELSIDNFRRQLKAFLFAQYWRWHHGALETLVPVRSVLCKFIIYIIIIYITINLNQSQLFYSGLTSKKTILYKEYDDDDDARSTHFTGEAYITNV